VTGPSDARLAEQLALALACDGEGRATLTPARFGPTAETRGIIVTGPSGAGKTTLIRRALAGLATTADASVEDPVDATPIMQVTVPSPATLKSLGLEILAATGYTEIAERRERWSIWQLVRHRLQLRQVRLIWLDEAQHLLGRTAEVGPTLDTLKTLMQGDHAVVVILSGVEGLDALVRVDPQVDRRFSRLALGRVRGAQDVRGVDHVIRAYCATAGLEPPAASDVARRLIHGADGRFGLCVEMIVDAIARALARGDKALDRQHFAEAWARRQGIAPDENVFLAERWSSIQTGAPREPARRGASGRRAGDDR
jgi:hypothetical protein